MVKLRTVIRSDRAALTRRGSARGKKANLGGVEFIDKNGFVSQKCDFGPNL
jgi:hypothetical protein